MPLNEHRRAKVKERWPMQFDIEGVERDSSLRKQLLEAQKRGEVMSPLGNSFQATPPRDLSKAVVQPYRYQEFPKIMYHPTNKTPQSVLARNKVLKHNELHPERPEVLPDLLPVTLTVKDEAEQKKAEARGFQEQAPHPYPEEADEQTFQEELGANATEDTHARAASKTRKGRKAVA